MRIAIGADHRGTHVIRQIEQIVRLNGAEVVDVTSCEEGVCDYPDRAYPVAVAVSRGEADQGILVCGTGVGMCISANKVAGIRAALAHDEISAEMARRHNDANVLCLSGDLLGQRMIERLVEVWLVTDFEGGRHARRVRKIAAIERGDDPRDLEESEG